jgi:hypothetical protein
MLMSNPIRHAARPRLVYVLGLPLPPRRGPRLLIEEDLARQAAACRHPRALQKLCLAVSVTQAAETAIASKASAMKNDRTAAIGWKEQCVVTEKP